MDGSSGAFSSQYNLDKNTQKTKKAQRYHGKYPKGIRAQLGYLDSGNEIGYTANQKEESLSAQKLQYTISILPKR